MSVMLLSYLASATTNGPDLYWPSSTTNNLVLSPPCLVAVPLRCRICSREWTGYRRKGDDIYRDEACISCGHVTAGPSDKEDHG